MKASQSFGGGGDRRQWTVGRRLGLGFGLVGGVVLFVAAMGNVYVQRLATTALEAELALSRDLFVAERRADHLKWVNDLQLTVTDRAEFKGQLDPTQCAFGKWLYGEAKEDGAVDPRLAILLAEIEEPHRHLHDSARAVLEANRGGVDEGRRVFVERTLPALDRVTAELATVKGHYGAQRQDASARLKRTVHNARLLLAVVGLTSLTATVVMAVAIQRGLIRHLRGVVADMRAGATGVAAAARQVSASAESLSHGATEQAASLEETSASLEEMTAMTRQSAEHMRDAAKLAADATQAVERSERVLGGLVDAMHGISDANERVASIIKRIDEIAFQTNILALNAAVEAARAGEQGMGFAVVADEVRTLAQRSAAAARDTAALIEESVTKARSGAAKVAEVETAIGSIIHGVTKVRSLVEDVSQASQQQAEGIGQISRAVIQMEQITQSTAATAEESAAASQELTAQAEVSVAIISRLDQLVAARSDAPAEASRIVKMPARTQARWTGKAATMPSGDVAALASTGTDGAF